MSWNTEQAQDFMSKIKPICEKYGFTEPKISGEAARLGHTEGSLDLVIKTDREMYDIDLEAFVDEIEYTFGAVRDWEDDKRNFFTCSLPGGYKVDFWFE